MDHFKKAKIVVTCLALFGTGSALANEAGPNALAFMQANQLQQVKQLLEQGKATEPTQEAYKRLIASADSALKQPSLSVMDKGMTPPSGSKHDYLSLSAYWWADADKANGLPWVRRDGQVNPASKNNLSDGVRLATFTARVQDLTLAWYFSGQQRYADKAASLLRAWFIDPTTRMNPNLNYAQGVPGMTSGRHDGVLDGRYFSTRIVDSLLMLRGNAAWSAHDDEAMHQWMQQYLQWLHTSPLAIKESKAKNNHGNWYATQVAGIAWYLNKPDLIKKMVALTESKLETQLKPDGTQPLELARTRSFHYSYFNLQAVSLLATVAKENGQDLWNYHTANGGGVLKSLDFMAQFVSGTKPWPYKSLDQLGVRVVPLLSWADNGTGQNRYQQQIRSAHYLFTDTQTNDGKAGNKETQPKPHKDATRGATIEAQRETWLTSLPLWAE
ncbi:alginate lyase [Serratia sp. Leaf50]|nr:alginate lyase [Serratia sp. Leaf50]